MAITKKIIKVKESDYIHEINGVKRRPLSASDLVEILIKKGILNDEDVSI